jgi:nitrite reductase/ring-hydroxylating ferredoxin subunit
MRLFLRNVKILASWSLLLLAVAGCSDDDRHPVPLVPVDFRIEVGVQHIELNSIGGHLNFYGGFGGIVIYRFSIDEFYAFDRACPVHPHDQNARIVVENSPLAKCNVCETTYLLIDGSVISGPGKYPLRQYRTVFYDPFLQVSSY